VSYAPGDVGVLLYGTLGSAVAGVIGGAVNILILQADILA